MKHTGRYSPTEDDYDLQGELDDKIISLGNIIDGIDSDGNKRNKKEILKGMINFLVEKL